MRLPILLAVLSVIAGAIPGTSFAQGRLLRFATAAPADGYGYGASSLDAQHARIIDVRRAASSPRAAEFLTESVNIDEDAPEEGTLASPLDGSAAPEPLRPAADEIAAPQPAIAGGFMVQIGAYSDPANAERMRSALAAYGDVAVDAVDRPDGRTVHRVRLGPMPTRSAAERARARVAAAGFADAQITTR